MRGVVQVLVVALLVTAGTACTMQGGAEDVEIVSTIQETGYYKGDTAWTPLPDSYQYPTHEDFERKLDDRLYRVLRPVHVRTAVIKRSRSTGETWKEYVETREKGSK